MIKKMKSIFEKEGLSGLILRFRIILSYIVLSPYFFHRYKKTFIIFESIPDLSDNTFTVFNELLKRKYNQKYSFVWATHNKKAHDSCIYYELHNFSSSSPSDIVKTSWILKRTKCIICCNGFIPPTNQNTKVFYLSHGGPIKNVRNYYNVPPYVNYCLVPSYDSIDKLAFQFKYPKEKIIALGYPRNDDLTKKSQTQIFDRNCFKKVIVWYPTFRQHIVSAKFTNCSNPIPIIHNQESALQCNTYARSLGILLVIKPHFAQDTQYIKDLNLSNILFIEDSFFQNHNITSYEFIASCDALITDYSSVYYDYLLCDKPVAAIWEDIEEYKQNPGFAVDIDYYWKAAEKIFDINDFLTFLDHVSSGTDPLKEERKEICKLVNYSDDGRNAERVTDFIIEKAGL